MNAFKIKIVEFISDDQPGFVAREFNDAWGNVHFFNEKVHVVTTDFLDEKSVYPQEGCIACEIVKKWTDTDNRNIITVNTEKRWSIETADGLSEFDLLEDWLVTI